MDKKQDPHVKAPTVYSTNYTAACGFHKEDSENGDNEGADVW